MGDEEPLAHGLGNLVDLGAPKAKTRERAWEVAAVAPLDLSPVLAAANDAKNAAEAASAAAQAASAAAVKIESRLEAAGKVFDQP